MPKSLTEVICSILERERGEMKLRVPRHLKKISFVLSVFIYLDFINSRPVKRILVFVL